MKINRKELLAAMKVATKIALGKGSFPILQCVLLDGAGQQLIATDLETTGFIPLKIEDYTREVPGEVEEDLEKLKGPELRQLAEDRGITLPKGKPKVAEIREAIMAAREPVAKEEWQEKFAINAKDAQRIITELEEDVIEIVVADEMATQSMFQKAAPLVRIGDNFHNLCTHPADEFPILEKAEGTDAATVLRSDLINVAMAIGDDDLKQVYFDLDQEQEKPYVVATDGHRMHWAPVVRTGSESFGLPLNAVGIIASAFPKKKEESEISIKYDGDKKLVQVPFGEGNKGIIQTRSHDKFVEDWRQFAEKTDSGKEVTIVKTDLEKPLQQALSLSAGLYNAIRVTFNGGINLEFTNPNKGDYQKVSIPIKKKTYGEDEEALFGFNGKFLLDAMGPITTEDMTIRFNKVSEPLRLAHENFNAIIMPMRV